MPHVDWVDLTHVILMKCILAYFSPKSFYYPHRLHIITDFHIFIFHPWLHSSGLSRLTVWKNPPEPQKAGHLALCLWRGGINIQGPYYAQYQVVLHFNGGAKLLSETTRLISRKTIYLALCWQPPVKMLLFQHQCCKRWTVFFFNQFSGRIKQITVVYIGQLGHVALAETCTCRIDQK